MNDDDRIAYLAGEPTGSIDDSDERADLDELRALLADPGLWDEPAPTLEDAVVAAVSNAVGDRSGHAPIAPLAARRHRDRPGRSSRTGRPGRSRSTGTAGGGSARRRCSSARRPRS